MLRKKLLSAGILCIILCAALRLFSSPERRQLQTLAPALCSRAKTTREEYTLEGGEENAPVVTVLHGKKPGKSVYVVAGLHGDESAAWQAGNLLKEADLAAGTLYILSPANEYGAENGCRTTRSGRDPNRWFGSDTHWDAALLDNAIALDLQKKQPDLILDLHEAHENALRAPDLHDALGNSIVCYSLDSIGDMVLDFLQETESSADFSAPFTLYSSPPAGSLNDYAGRVLGLSAITVETWRGDPPSERVQTQLRTVSFFLQDLGMIF